MAPIASDLLCLENESGTGVLIHKAKAPAKMPEGKLAGRKRPPSYQLKPYEEWKHTRARLEADQALG